jgi:XrtJ-associated TM-motif-TM protein
MKKLGYVLTFALATIAATLPLSAQSGCVDSPENPTAVLGLIVSAAGIGFVQVRSRIRARKAKKDNQTQG